MKKNLSPVQDSSGQAWRRRQANIRQVDDPELIAIDAAFK